MNVSWHTPGQSPLAGDIVGREAVFARLGRYVVETGGTFRADLKRVLTDEDGRVIGIHHNVAERGDRQLDVYCIVVFESRTAGSWTAASTSTTSAPGTSSGRRADNPDSNGGHHGDTNKLSAAIPSRSG